MDVRSRSILRWSLLVYAASAVGLSLLQADYINADFIAYATVARRLVEAPGSGISAYWSPLYSWLMIPLVLLGVDDLVAGRCVAVASGGLYLWAIDRWLFNVLRQRRQTDRFVCIGVMTCATLQAVLWSTYLLDPDLLANGLLYLYFAANFERGSFRRPLSALAGGLAAGAAYLAKAYMLPFCTAHFLATMAFVQLRSRTSAGSARLSFASWKSMISFFVGLSVLAGPWIVCLSFKLGRPTFSTAGSANHANVSPENFGRDPLWRPGLTPDYIFEPHLAPDWSPFEDAAHFRHQLRLVLHNARNGIGLTAGWLAMFGLSAVWRKARRRRLPPVERSLVRWIVMTAGLYCAGYMTVNLEARYIVPTVAPLLCLGSLLMLRAGFFSTPLAPSLPAPSAPLDSTDELGPDGSESKSGGGLSRFLRSPAAVVVLVLLFGAADIDRLARVAVVHPQMMPMAKMRAVVHSLPNGYLLDAPWACNSWHNGAAIAYAADRFKTYWGTSNAPSGPPTFDDMAANGVQAFLCFLPADWQDSNAPVGQRLSHSPHWTREGTIRDPALLPWKLEVYVRRD